MRSFQFRFLNIKWLSVLIMVLTVVLVACAGDNSPASSAPSSGAAAQQLDPTQPPEPLAAVVNDQPITLAEFERERARRALGMVVEPATAEAFDASVIQTMIDQVLIEQAAEQLGIVVTDEEIDAELAIQSEIASQNNQTLEDLVAVQLYTMDEYREAQRGMLLVQRVSDVVATVSPNAVQVHSRHILVADEATARDLIAQLEQGADFGQLATQYSLDSSTAPTGGDLDWVSRGDLLQPEVEDAVFSLQPGTYTTTPVASSLGYHIIEVLERVEDRPLSQAALAEKKQQAFLAWLDNQRAAATIEWYVGTGSQQQ